MRGVKSLVSSVSVVILWECSCYWLLLLSCRRQETSHSLHGWQESLQVPCQLKPCLLTCLLLLSVGIISSNRTA